MSPWGWHFGVSFTPKDSIPNLVSSLYRGAAVLFLRRLAVEVLMKDLFWNAVKFIKPRWHVQHPTWREYVLLTLAYGSLAFLAGVAFGVFR